MIFRCTIPHSSAGCSLYQEDQVRAPSLLRKERDDFNISRVPKGSYSCLCFTGALHSNGLLSARPWIWW